MLNRSVAARFVKNKGLFSWFLPEDDAPVKGDLIIVRWAENEPPVFAEVAYLEYPANPKANRFYLQLLKAETIRATDRLLNKGK